MPLPEAIVRQRGPAQICQVALLVVAALAGVATSSPREPTHRPVYLDWKSFRAAVTVLPPQPMASNGKIYAYRTWLLHSEPGRGFHVIDNTDPSHPRPAAYVRVPSHHDLAVRGGFLYADSAVDLLVFKLGEVGAAAAAPDPPIALVHRLRDVFPYDPFRSLPPDGCIVPERGWMLDRDRGVVLRWEPIHPERRDPCAR